MYARILLVGLLVVMGYCAVAAAGLQLTVQSANTTCGKNNGKIIVTASAGTAPYSYSWNGNGPYPNGNFISLPSGTYSIHVTDANGLFADTTIILTNQFTAPAAAITKKTIPTACAATDASLTLQGTGGLPPYSFSIDETNFQATPFFPNLTAGYYHYAVKDANGCISQTGFFNSVVLEGNCNIYQQGQGLSYVCGPFRSELILFNVAGGTAPYMYSLDGITYQSSNIFDPLPAGTYTVHIKDATGQILLFSAVLVDYCNPYLQLNTHIIKAHCAAADGSVTVTASTGLAPYQYSIDGVNFQSSNQFSGLAAGNYTLTVKDADNFINSILVIVNKSCMSVSATVTNGTCGNNNGSIQGMATGGTAPYMYSLNKINFTGNNVFSNLLAGNYWLYVKDVAGGLDSAAVTVSNSGATVFTGTVNTPTGCLNNNGTVLIGSTTTARPLLYSMDNGNFQTDSLFTGLSGGKHSFSTKDANGCIYSRDVIVTTFDDLTIDAGADTAVCQGTPASLKAISGAVQFSWSPAAGLDNPFSATPMATPPTTTKYYVKATAGVCTHSDSVVVTINPLPVAVAGTGVTVCPGKDAQIAGSGGVSAQWSPAVFLANPSSYTTAVLKPNRTTSYQLTVTGANGCMSNNTATTTVTVTAPPQLFAGNDTAVVAGQPLNLLAADVNNSGFSGYQWNPPAGLSGTAIANPVATLHQPGNYTYTVTAETPAGCRGNDTLHINVFTKADIYVAGAFTPNYDNNNDVLHVKPIGIKTFGMFALYDRWGNRVFQTGNPAVGWDGTNKGQPLQAGTVFVWMASGIDYSGNLVQKKGTVVLLK